ncbi:HAD-IIB family hydrolase [Acidobacteriota bacterium]
MIEKNSTSNRQLLIFSDLDGSLLDDTNYSYEPALPAITALRERDIPLVFCTSKTRAEIEPLRTKLNNTHPFISENGGAIYIPREYFLKKWKNDREDEKYLIIELGTPYTQIRKIMDQIQQKSGVQIRGFGDLVDKEIALFCDFSEEDARLAKQREYDEPFFLEDKGHLLKIKEIAAQANLQITRGGRFFHLMGKNDKGKATRKLREIYEAEKGPCTTIGIGDSLNDMPMLNNVDYPVLLQKSDGKYDESINWENLIHAPGMGPTGWRDAIISLLDELGIDISQENRT